MAGIPSSVPSAWVRAGLAAIVASFLAGCGSSFDFEGRWKGNRNLPVRPGEDAAIVRTLGMVDLSIRGGRFEVVESGVPYEGTVSYRDGKAFLRIESYFGKPLSEQPAFRKLGEAETVLTPQEDGTLAYADPAGFDTSAVVLHREPKP